MGLSERFDRLSAVAVDASSIIYMLKAGFLGLLGHTIRLQTIEVVRAETGWHHPQIEVRPEPPPDPRSPNLTPPPEGFPTAGALPGGGPMPNDERFLRFAAAGRLPVVSEDRELLVAAGALGLEHYNSLMMLLFLRYQGRIDEEWYEEARTRLLSEARYHEDVLRRFEGYSRELGF